MVGPPWWYRSVVVVRGWYEYSETRPEVGYSMDGAEEEWDDCWVWLVKMEEEEVDCAETSATLGRRGLEGMANSEEYWEWSWDEGYC